MISYSRMACIYMAKTKIKTSGVAYSNRWPHGSYECTCMGMLCCWSACGIDRCATISCICDPVLFCHWKTVFVAGKTLFAFPVSPRLHGSLGKRFRHIKSITRERYQWSWTVKLTVLMASLIVFNYISYFPLQFLLFSLAEIQIVFMWIEMNWAIEWYQMRSFFAGWPEFKRPNGNKYLPRDRRGFVL